jgi:hypothetical protein
MFVGGASRSEAKRDDGSEGCENDAAVHSDVSG